MVTARRDFCCLSQGVHSKFLIGESLAEIAQIAGIPGLPDSEACGRRERRVTRHIRACMRAEFSV